MNNPCSSIALFATIAFAVVAFILFLARNNFQPTTKSDLTALTVFAEFFTLHAERDNFVQKIDAQVGGVRYLGAGSAHMMNKKWAQKIRGEESLARRVQQRDIEDLWRTADGHYFLFKCVFLADGLKSKLDATSMVPLTSRGALLWAKEHSHGRNIDHIR